MITQTLALLVDAYRELNAKRLFWIVLLLSALFVGAMASIGINDKGITILQWSFENEFMNTKTLTKAAFYKSVVFIPIGFNIWLSWAATILALISTASIIPDFISSGSIELALSRPIGRLRLFLTKYATGLLFVTLQVAVFSLGAFLVIGIRGESWEPRIFMSIPLIVAFFSYLFAFCALVGLITRSTIASLLVTILLWVAIFLVHTAEASVLLGLKERQQVRIEQLEKSVQVDLPKRIAEQEAKAVKPAEPASAPSDSSPEAGKAREEFERAGRLADRAQERADRMKQQLVERTKKLEEAREALPKLEGWHKLFFAVKTLLPKTSETLKLLEREVTSISDLQGLSNNRQQSVDLEEGDRELNIDDRDIAVRVENAMRERSVWWVLGTSLVFEGVILGIASWIFVRRDF